MNLPQVRFAKPSLVPGLKKLFVFLLALALSIFLASFFTGFLSALSANIQLSGVTGTLSFDPLITIAYIITYHYAAHFFSLAKPTSFKFFLLTLLLSFTTSFVPGSLFLLFFMFFIKKFLPSPTSANR